MGDRGRYLTSRIQTITISAVFSQILYVQPRGRMVFGWGVRLIVFRDRTKKFITFLGFRRAMISPRSCISRVLEECDRMSQFFLTIWTKLLNVGWKVVTNTLGS